MQSTEFPTKLLTHAPVSEKTVLTKRVSRYEINDMNASTQISVQSIPFDISFKW